MPEHWVVLYASVSPEAELVIAGGLLHARMMLKLELRSLECRVRLLRVDILPFCSNRGFGAAIVWG